MGTVGAGMRTAGVGIIPGIGGAGIALFTDSTAGPSGIVGEAPGALCTAPGDVRAYPNALSLALQPPQQKLTRSDVFISD
jgi:hypothetical protein